MQPDPHPPTNVTYLCPCCAHSLGFLSLCPVSVLSWGQKIRTPEQGRLGFRFPSGRVSKAVTNNWLPLPLQLAGPPRPLWLRVPGHVGLTAPTTSHL